ncbi:MAG: hypothetical protein ACR65O_09510 [Methylomicrobium sp.]
MTVEYFFAALALACIGAYFVWRNNFKVRQANAAAALRAAFSPEISTLESPARTGNVRDILVSTFDRHSEAVTNFKWFLSKSSQRRFNQAWQQYHSGHEFDAEAWNIPIKERLFMEYFSIHDQSEATKYALKQIHNLLQFAKQP